MLNNALKISTVFADKTRFSIYQYIMNCSKGSCTVKEVAQEFSIHPNVARLHLSKLEEIGLLESGWDHQSAPGRPGRIYTLGRKAVTMSFPPRNFSLLGELAIEALASIGEPGKKALEQSAQRCGLESAQRVSRQFKNSLHEEIPAQIQSLLMEMGMISNTNMDKEGSYTIQFRNCPFREAAERFQSLACGLHRALVSGIWEHFHEGGKVETCNCKAFGDDNCSMALLAKID